MACESRQCPESIHVPGTDLSRLANVKRLSSWLGLCPATKISGRKVLSARTKRSAN